MSWDDSYQPGAINGIPVMVRTENTSFGRRSDVAISPGADRAQFVDLGPSIRPIRISAIFNGPNYAPQRNAFLQVISGPGPLSLMHPHYGPLFVVLADKGAVVTHTDDESRKASVELSLTEVGVADFLQRLDTVQAVSVAMLALDDSLITSPPTLPSNDPNLLSKLQDLGFLLEVVQGKIAARLNVVDHVTSAVQGFSDGLAGIASTPAQMFTKITGVVTAVFDLFKTARDLGPDVQTQSAIDQVAVLMESIEDLAEFALDEIFVPPLAPSAVIDQRNARGLSAGIRFAGLSAGSTQLAETELDSADQALELQDKLVALFDTAREPDLTTEVRTASREAQGAITEHLRRVSATLPQITHFTPKRTMPAVLIAYHVHGDALRGSEISRRNKLRAPHLVPPDPLEIKRDPPQT